MRLVRLVLTGDAVHDPPAALPAAIQLAALPPLPPPLPVSAENTGTLDPLALPPLLLFFSAALTVEGGRYSPCCGGIEPPAGPPLCLLPPLPTPPRPGAMGFNGLSYTSCSLRGIVRSSSMYGDCSMVQTGHEMRAPPPRTAELMPPPWLLRAGEGITSARGCSNAAHRLPPAPGTATTCQSADPALPPAVGF